MMNDHQILFIRADASSEIGTGHVMRCIALGQAFQDNAECRMQNDERKSLKATGIDDQKRVTSNQEQITERVVFICAELPGKLEERLYKEGFEVFRIDVVPGSPQDAQKTLQIINKYNPHNSNSNVHPSDFIPHPSAWLVLDGYRFKTDYQRAIRSGHQEIDLLKAEGRGLKAEVGLKTKDLFKAEDLLKAEGRGMKAEVRSETEERGRNVSDISLSNPERRTKNQEPQTKNSESQKTNQERITNNLQQITKLLVIDDYNHLPEYECDLLLNQNLGAEKYTYNINPEAKLLLGPKYVLLRREFRDAAKKREENQPRKSLKFRKKKRTPFREFRVFRGGIKTMHRLPSGRFISRFSKVPTIGSFRKKSSNHWKFSKKKFQPLEVFEKKVPTIGKKILVTLGGADSKNITKKIMEALDHCFGEHFSVLVLVGGANPRMEVLSECCHQQAYPCEIMYATDDMPGVLSKVDAVITTASTTAIEALFMGKVVMVGCTSQNQVECMNALSEEEPVVVAGWYEDLSLQDWFLPLRELGALMSVNSQDSRIDGRGANEVVGVICCVL